MDVEARRKFCGLLMFENVSATKSSGRELDPSSSGSSSTFVFANSPVDEAPRALAAGAAAGDEDSQGMGSRSSKSGAAKRTPRPPNAFILYRREKQPAIIAAQRHLSNAEVSRQISEMWRNESEETRLKWERFADRKKLEHMKAYPDYVYRPNKTKTKSEKMDKRRQQRRRESTNAAGEVQEATSATGPIRRRTRPVSRQSSEVTPPLSQPNTPLASQVDQQVAYAMVMPNGEMLVDDLGQPLITTEALSSPLTPISPPTLLRDQEFQKMRQHQRLQARVVPEEDYYHHSTQAGNAHFAQHHQQQQQQQQQQQTISLSAINHFYPGPTVDSFWPVPDVLSSTQHILDQTMLYVSQETSHPAPSVATVMSSPSLSSTDGSDDTSPTIPSQPDTVVNPAIYGESPEQYLAGTEQFVHMLAGYGLNEYLDGSGNHPGAQSS